MSQSETRLELRTEAVGPWPVNTYVLVCPTTRRSVLIDPGADPETLLEMLADTEPVGILLTHTHPDHFGALEEMRATLDVLPDGLDTSLGERGINLSGGQKQRATIARALYRDTPILVLDDSLSAVDTVTEEAILAGLREFMADRTSIVVSHRVTAVAAADAILVLEDGELVETGTHAELLARGGVYARLLERQLLEEEIEREEAV